MFKTKFDAHARVLQNPGTPVKVNYAPRYDAHGVLDLEAVGQTDLYAYIQSHADSCDIHVILDRFANGETDVLSQMQGFYADCSDMPKTYAEVLNSVIAGEHAFAGLPAEVKQRFGNSFAQWLASFDKPDFGAKMGFDTGTMADVMTNAQKQDFVSNAGAVPAPSTGSSGAPGAVPAPATPPAPAQ